MRGEAGAGSDSGSLWGVTARPAHVREDGSAMLGVNTCAGLTGVSSCLGWGP